MSFQSSGLAPCILRAVDDAGYRQPTPIQAKSIPLILKQRDVIGLAQTGTGKTAAFALPLLSELSGMKRDRSAGGTRILIIAPTRELVVQVEQEIQTYGRNIDVRTLAVTGRVSEKDQISKLNAGVDVVVATPGRLLALMDAGHAVFGQLTHLVLDEADRMLDMGFAPDIYAVVDKLPKRRQSLLFSATFPQQVEKLSRYLLKSPVTVEVGGRGNPAETVEQMIYPVEQHLKTDLLIRLLDDHQFFSVIAFVKTKDEVDVVTKELKREGIEAEAIHSDRSPNHRFRALRDFKASKIRVLVATDIAARGLDIENVTHVINYDFPVLGDDYIHRIGRTGRAGADGCAITFLTSTDGDKLQKLERQIGRTLPRRTVDDFNYRVPAPEVDETEDRSRSKAKPKRYASDRFERSSRQQAKKTARQSKRGGGAKSPGKRSGGRNKR